MEGRCGKIIQDKAVIVIVLLYGIVLIDIIAAYVTLTSGVVEVNERAGDAKFWTN